MPSLTGRQQTEYFGWLSVVVGTLLFSPRTHNRSQQLLLLIHMLFHDKPKRCAASFLMDISDELSVGTYWTKTGLISFNPRTRVGDVSGVSLVRKHWKSINVLK